MTTAVCLLLTVVLADSTSAYEQKAIDHFFHQIWQAEYRKYKVIEFANRTDTTYGGVIFGCEAWDEASKKKIADAPVTELKLLKTPPGISIRKWTDSKRIKLRAGNAIRTGATFVVQLDVYKPLEFVHHYFIRINKTGTIIDTCVSMEVI